MKINCPTSMTNPAAIAPLLDVIDKYGFIKSREATNTIFPTARSTVSRWNPEKPDTHSEGQLFQYGLIEYIPGSDDKEFKLTFLGKRFLEIFEKREGQINAEGEKEKDKYICKDGMEYAYNAVLIDCLLTWKLTVGGKSLHPGLLLLKLMVDSRMNDYIFENEWAYVCNSDYAGTLDYESLVKEITGFREEGIEPPVESSGNTYAFLIAFANSWQIFEKQVVDSKNKFILSDITKGNLKSKMLEIDTLMKEDDSILSKISEKDKMKPLKYDTEEDFDDYERNRIIFGAPGTGKSFSVNKDREKLLKELCEDNYERVTFHPDYTYANFVGTYKPVPTIDDDGKEAITYKYVPGPFMRIYVEAVRSAQSDSPKPYLLIIEEINRANVAAVFGDVFQLLDRDDKNISEYEIETSNDMRKYLSDKLGVDESVVKSIKIPNNMFIWATMNSADQGVFLMDTAFKRRWDFTYKGINENDQDIQGKTVVLGSKVKQRVEWNALRKAINDFLAKQKINEDKQLGPYFVSKKIVVPESGNEIDSDKFIKVFKNKVIMYLFEDAAKQKKDKLFEGCFQNSTRYSEICREFDEKGIGIFNHDIQLASNPVDIVENTEGITG